jgi:ribosomal protein S18 acetylase RimI-like enzyme
LPNSLLTKQSTSVGLVLTTVVRARSGQLAAFAHFRFEYEDQAAAYGVPGRPTLYLYEIQLVTPFRRMGLGKHLMRFDRPNCRLLEMIALRNQLECVMLTVQNENHSAAAFYKSLSYRTDPSDPSQFVDSVPQPYTIVSKSLRRK